MNDRDDSSRWWRWNNSGRIAANDDGGMVSGWWKWIVADDEGDRIVADVDGGIVSDDRSEIVDDEGGRIAADDDGGITTAE